MNSKNSLAAIIILLCLPLAAFMLMFLSIHGNARTAFLQSGALVAGAWAAHWLLSKVNLDTPIMKAQQPLWVTGLPFFVATVAAFMLTFNYGGFEASVTALLGTVGHVILQKVITHARSKA